MKRIDQENKDQGIEEDVSPSRNRLLSKVVLSSDRKPSRSPSKKAKTHIQLKPDVREVAKVSPEKS